MPRPPRISTEAFQRKRQLLTQLDTDFSQWRPYFEEIATFLLPRRYVWLSPSAATVGVEGSGIAVSQNAQAVVNNRNSRILDPTGTVAARTLANGLMNGITSPARPWFRLRLTEFSDDQEGYPKEYLVWLEECARRMHLILAESNFYTAMGMLYLELSGFGTSALLIYEDFEEVIRCYNSPMGEYRLIQDNRRMVTGYARTFNMTVGQTVAEFGIDNVCEQTRLAYRAGGQGLLRNISICHLIEQNNPDDPAAIGSQFRYREFYWEHTQNDGSMLRIKGFHEKPLVAPRWELMGNDTYGTSPAMDALPEIKQLQLETKQKGQALDKMIRPPIVADVALRNSPTALLPGGISYVPSSSQIGAKPIFTVNPPLDAMTMDIMRLQERIKTIFYNHLFRNVSDLNTVRSAAEIYERKAEDMVLLGPILERFENEALDPAIIRVFNIAKRKGLLPPPPPGLDDSTIDIQYVSVLSDAQRAVTTGSIERFMQVVGQLAAAVPEVLRIPDYPEMVREYASRLNVPAKILKGREQVAAELQQEQELLQAQQAALVGSELTGAAKNLSATDVGGGQNALQALLGG